VTGPTSGTSPIEITLLNSQRSHAVDRVELLGFLERLAREHRPRDADRFAVCLVSDRRMREANRRFRSVDATTDVLSFPWEGDAPDPDGGAHLGDILISVPRASEQARQAGHGLERELKILLIHGYLHLQGYDHETDDGTMLRLQSRLVRRLIDRSERETRLG
jgi:probable rRNA maturation factor